MESRSLDDSPSGVSRRCLGIGLGFVYPNQPLHGRQRQRIGSHQLTKRSLNTGANGPIRRAGGMPAVQEAMSARVTDGMEWDGLPFPLHSS